LGGVGDGGGEVLAAGVGQAAAAEECGVVRAEPEGLGVIGDGLLVVALAGVGVAAVDAGAEVAGVGLQGGGVLGDGGLVHVVLDPVDEVVVGQGGQAIEHEAEVFGPLADGPGGAVVEELPPGFGEEDAVAGVGVGPAGEGEGAEFAEAVDVGVGPDPDLALGLADDLGG